MKEIKLTQNTVTQVDDEDYEYINQWKWHTQSNKVTKYAVRTSNKIAMHRVIMNTPKGLQVDHIDHNGLNNQKANLRNCTHGQNQMNRKSSGKSKYLGVYLDKRNRTKKFRAMIRVDNKNIYLGSFLNEREAALVYNDNAIIYHGEFAKLNIL